MMRSASRQAFDELRAQEDVVFGGSTHAGVSGDTLSALAGELYAVAGLLLAQPRLRRTLGDPATSPESRAQLAGQLLEGKVSAKAVELVRAAVALRWSSPWDLTDAIEGAGDDALFSVAEKDGSLDRVEEELFRFERILDNEGSVIAMLDEVSAPVERRAQLLESLLAGKVSPVTLVLLQHAVASERKRSITLAIDDLLESATARQERSVARVTSAVPLTAAQQERLSGTLSTMYGRAISVRTAVDPQVRGGLVVRVGDEVIDGSIATRFAAARAALAS